MSQLPPSVDLSKTPLIPPPTDQTSNFFDPPSLAPVAEGIGGLLIAIETTLLILRTCSNVKTFGKVRFEDYWTIWAAVLTYGYFALIMCFRPVARHAWDIPLTEATEGLYKSAFAQVMMLGSTIFFSKTSLLLLYYRIFSPDRFFRYKLYGAFAFIAVTTLSSIPMYLAICLPGSDHSWAGGSAKCGKTVVYSYVQGPTNVAFDIFLIYLPASVIVHLQVPLRRKLGILAIFMTGLLALVAGIIGLVFRIRLVHASDYTWGSYIVELCLLIESCVSIICSCMPTIPAIFKLVAANSYFISLRSRLRSRYASSDKSDSSKKSSRSKAYPGNKNSNESEPYIGLVNNGANHVGTRPAIKTHIEHVAWPERLDEPGINMLVEIEMSSTNKTLQESGKE